MDVILNWGRTFPVIGIIVCVLAIVILKKVFGRSGPDSGLNTAIFVLFCLMALCVAAAAWGFKNVKPPDHAGEWK